MPSYSSEDSFQTQNDEMQEVLRQFLVVFPQVKDKNTYPTLSLRVVQDREHENTNHKQGRGEGGNKYRTGQMIILITGQAKDRLLLKTIRDQLKLFHDTRFERIFKLFPIYHKKNIKQQSLIGIQIGADEEVNGNQEDQQISLVDRYFVYKYLTRGANLNQQLIVDAGVPLQEALILTKDDFLSIEIKTVKKHFVTIRQNLETIIGNTLTKSVQTNSYISLMSNFTKPIYQKLMDRYNVFISCPVKIEINKDQYNDRGRGGRGTYQEGNHNKPPGSFLAKEISYQFTRELDGFTPQIINQEYMITGSFKDVQNAMIALKKKVEQYVLVTEQFKSTRETFQEFEKRKDEIQSQTKVYTRTMKQEIAYVGKLDNIQQAKEEIKSILELQMKLKEYIKFDSKDYRLFMKSKDIFKQIAIQRQCNLYINMDQIEISGNKQAISECLPLVRELIQQISSSTMSELISHPQMCIVLEDLKKDSDFENIYKVQARRVGQRDQQKDINQEPQIIPQVQSQEIVDAAQWAFKIFNNANDSKFWNARADKNSDFWDYDTDQNWQIERHFQDCFSGLKPLNARYRITGDANQVKNRYSYEIWGTSTNPSTWKQQNITVSNGQIRQLQRRTVKKSMKVISHEKQSSEVLDQLCQDIADGKVRRQMHQEEENKQSLSIIDQQMSTLNIQPNQFGFTIIGLKQDVINLKAILQDRATNPKEFKSQINGGQYNMNNHIISKIQKFFKVQYNDQDLVGIAITNKYNDIQITGFKHQEVRNKVALLLEKIKSHKFPDHWENIIELVEGNNSCVLINLLHGCPEWKQVEQNFKVTMQAATIDKIERVQNRKLWRVFQHEVDYVHQKNNGQSAIANLFYGTSGTPPQIIYQSEEGFNINYSNDGMWGKPIQFAYNSSYSNSYSSKLPDGSRQMFMAQVLIGKEIVMNPDRTLKEPPLQPGTNLKYDSVKGNTGGSDVIMVYSNKKAYPQYLITYRV